ncbi:MAG: RHH-type proline utilization regulon transcriptional repressor/proline dehydrogenase [Glaciecola sp.]|jgi:RHH-type proline utilization regulon transcriptional repressor/proline dehydrogenase/delta 1-pyrroline-5-carboxylate dehydrogenase|uniref:bifunctional proline dehydrogenase/L-glutamate gamma-semialdehyde dehydrogenase PutA n=1 Tax=Congregibacter sp. TaxID=2744308 RepID=UPI0039E6898C
MKQAITLESRPMASINEGELDAIRAHHVADEEDILAALAGGAGIDLDLRQRAQSRAVDLIECIRNAGKPGLMEMFLAEYGLSTNEGIALMCLAEALLRVPDPGTIDTLIEDKIAPYDWSEHSGKSGSAVVNASTIALMMTGRVLDDDNSASVSGLLNRTVKRLGEPVVRLAVKRAMREMGNQFVLGQTIEEALKRAEDETRRGFRYSFDMLGEAALTQAGADEYFEAYADAIRAIGKSSAGGALHERPGISVKLSALHPRFEYAKQARLLKELAPRLNTLARLARDANLGLNVDAEESQRLEPFLHVVKAALSDEELAGWDGFGVVVQAYQKRAAPVIDWLYKLASSLDRRIMVRLVKGAYWDSEIKQAQVDGVSDYPVFTRRSATDISYICCAAKLLGMTDRIYPQFATHNAQTAATILELAGDRADYEFQRLHGMGETLFNQLITDGANCRIYAPVGPHKDLLAYLVRRLLENGANSSFVHKVVDPAYTPISLAEDPFTRLSNIHSTRPALLAHPADIYAPERQASRGWDLNNSKVIEALELAREHFATHHWQVEPLLACPMNSDVGREIVNPANPSDVVGYAIEVSSSDCEGALAEAKDWNDAGAQQRAFTLRLAADLFETNTGELMALLAREAGKCAADAVAEIREAVDFLRYYANRGEDLANGEARGIITCISPWNFPLAIFTGQLAAALAAGNGVLAKPAETTPLIAAAAVKLLHTAGVPREVLQFLPGDGASVGQALTASSTVAGVCFTGSTATARMINRSMAAHMSPAAPLIAETGGINAGIVDSTALPEQAVRDALASAFQSAGQRCSALRVLYVQDDIADILLEMLHGAMDELELGDPWSLATDIGPVINAQAQESIQTYIDEARQEGRLLKQLAVPKEGYFVGPAVIEVAGIADVTREVFGPVLHVARFKAEDFHSIIDDINASGYGLTFGLHTRIDERVKNVSSEVHAGNIYVNRNQIGAVVESQPFGGEGLSGTGPKAGGPRYVQRFQRPMATAIQTEPAMITGTGVDATTVQAAIDALSWYEAETLEIQDMPGPTGEANILTILPRGLVLCLGPTAQEAALQAGTARRRGCPALMVAPGVDPAHGIDGVISRTDLSMLQNIAVVALWSDTADLALARQALAAREGALIPLVSVSSELDSYCVRERHTCIDTTAAGGNASLLAADSD